MKLPKNSCNMARWKKFNRQELGFAFLLDADGKGDPKNILLNGGLMAIYDGRK